MLKIMKVIQVLMDSLSKLPSLDFCSSKTKQNPKVEEDQQAKTDGGKQAQQPRH